MKDFLDMYMMLGTMIAEKHACFHNVVMDMGHMEHHKLHKFIIDSNYFTFNPIFVTTNLVKSHNHLPKTSTYNQTLVMPPQGFDCLMKVKVVYASLHGEYGHF